MRLINDLRFGCCCRRRKNDDDEDDDDDDDDNNDASVDIVTAILNNIDKRFDVAPGSALQLATFCEDTDWFETQFISPFLYVCVLILSPHTCMYMPVSSDDFIVT